MFPLKSRLLVQKYSQNLEKFAGKSSGNMVALKIFTGWHYPTRYGLLLSANVVILQQTCYRKSTNTLERETECVALLGRPTRRRCGWNIYFCLTPHARNDFSSSSSEVRDRLFLELCIQYKKKARMALWALVLAARKSRDPEDEEEERCSKLEDKTNTLSS